MDAVTNQEQHNPQDILSVTSTGRQSPLAE